MLTALPAVTHSEAYVSTESTDTRYQNVPVPLTPLIGREREREAVRELLLRPEVRVVTLTGIGGIGKTHLALSVGNEVQEAFAQGVCFVSLAKISDSERVIPAITHALGLCQSGKIATQLNTSKPSCATSTSYSYSIASSRFF